MRTQYLYFSLALMAACSANKTTEIHPCRSPVATKITADSVLHLDFDGYIPKGFAVENPAGHWLYVYDGESDSGAEKILRGSTISFNLDELEAAGSTGNVKVFVDSGLYRLYFADNLDTEPENTTSCSLTVIYEP